MNAVHAFLRLDIRVKDHRAGGDAECRPVYLPTVETEQHGKEPYPSEELFL